MRKELDKGRTKERKEEEEKKKGRKKVRVEMLQAQILIYFIELYAYMYKI